MKKLMALILCATMLVTLAACNKDKDKPATEPETEPVEIKAADVYDEAARRTKEMTSYMLNIDYNKEMTVGVDTFNYHTTQTVKFFDVGQDSFAASLSERTMNGMHIIDSNERYAGGALYGTLDEFKYKVNMPAEEYISEFVPAVPMDASLYDTVIQQEDGNIKLTGASAAEEWLGDGIELTEASGLVELTEDGGVKKSTYYAEYDQGPAHVNLDVAVTVMATEDGDSESGPPDKESYVEINDYRAPRIVRNASSNIVQAKSIATKQTETTTSEAGPASSSVQISFYAYENGDIQELKLDEIGQIVDLATGEEYSYTYKKSYKDGTETSQYSDEKPETATRDYDTSKRENIDVIALEMPSHLVDITGMELVEIGDSILVKYNYSDENAEYREGKIAYWLFNDENTVMDAASDFSVNTNTGYIGIDKVTGLPTASGVDFMGYHTIEGDYYKVSESINQSIHLGGTEAYKEITGEELPEDEPTEKATPLFYRVTGDNGEEMWLMGTIHVGDNRTSYLPDEVYEALDGSDSLAVEVDIEDFMTQLKEDEEKMAEVFRNYIYTDGSLTLNHIKDANVYHNALSLIIAGGEYNAAYLMLKPTVIAETIESMYMRQGYSKLTPDKGVDEQLVSRANEKGIKVLNVESGEEQMKMLTGFNDTIQELLLASVCDATQSEYNKQLNEMFEMWCRGDESELTAYLADETSDLTDEELEVYNEYNKEMVVDRNERMLEVAKGYLESGDTVFYAVGLAHLLTPNGLVNTLREAGYKVEAVSYR